jgi:NAD(P)-dependent dehydrogenase (short-subunit alcohol dehydrogenase family)
MSKTILITGASSGFGRITAEALAHAGHKVFASMRDPNTKNRNQAQELRQKGIAVVELDIGSDTSVDLAVKEVMADAGHIDVLINNAELPQPELRKRSRLTKPKWCSTPISWGCFVPTAPYCQQCAHVVMG